MNKYLSRKFLLALAVVAAAAVIVSGADPDQVAAVLERLGADATPLQMLVASIQAAIKGIAAIIGAAVVVARYLSVQGELDAQGMALAADKIVQEVQGNAKKK